MKEFTTLKYPLRWLFQIINISLLICLFFSLFTKKIELNNFYSVIIVLLLFLEFFSIVYFLRNKMYCYIGKDKKIYLIKRKQLASDEQRKTSEGLIVDHFRFDDKTIDTLNFLDILLALPSKKKIQKKIKDKVLTYPKYQVKTVKQTFKFLGSYCYTITFEDNTKKFFIVFNYLKQED